MTEDPLLAGEVGSLCVIVLMVHCELVERGSGVNPNALGGPRRSYFPQTGARKSRE
jgi:hypothetical protein